MLALALVATGVSVFVNGRPLQSDVPPLVEAGRAMLPARAVFESLGASVNYDHQNRITIERGKRIVRIVLGSKRASVNGRYLRLDVAPSLYRGRAMVPLRFVAESLGAAVAYDRETRQVAIADARAPQLRSPYATSPAAPGYALPTVEYRRPAPGEVVSGPFPSIAAAIETHGGPPVEGDSVRLFIDGRDVTDKMFREGDEIGYTPAVELTAGTHEVTVQGADVQGARFTANWDFQSTFAYSQPAANLGYAAPVVYLLGPAAYVYGSTVQFVLLAPSGGSGYLNLCGYAPQFPFAPGSDPNRYVVSLALPPGIFAPNCYVTGYYFGPNGTPSYFVLATPLQIDTRPPPPAPTPTPLPPSHLRRPLSHPSASPSAGPTRPPSPQPSARPTATPSPRPSARVTPRPKPRFTPNS